MYGFLFNILKTLSLGPKKKKRKGHPQRFGAISVNTRRLGQDRREPQSTWSSRTPWPPVPAQSPVQQDGQRLSFPVSALGLLSSTQDTICLQKWLPQEEQAEAVIVMSARLDPHGSEGTWWWQGCLECFLSGPYYNLDQQTPRYRPDSFSICFSGNFSKDIY